MPSHTAHRTIAIVQAGGAGGRMDVLTAEQAKPALPFAGSYQLLDFPLSNLVNSGIDDVWLSVQYQAESLEAQVRNGRPWDLDRTRGGLRLLAPRQGSGSLDDEGFAHGNADELYRLRDDVRRSGADVVLVLSADHVYRLDHRDLVARHLEKQAELTMVTTDIRDLFADDPADHAVVLANRQGRVTDFAYKPERPQGTIVATEVFAYDADVLVEVLEELHREISGADSEREPGDSGLGDFGDLLVPRLVERGRVYTHHTEGYWRDLGQPHHYLNAHLELLDGRTDLFDRSWPIRTQQPERVAAFVEAGAVLENSLLSAGARVAGSVNRSVVGPGSVIEAGAQVIESVISANVTICSGAKVVRSVIDADTHVGTGVTVGSHDTRLDDADAITLVGADCRVMKSDVPSGGRVPPGSTC